MSATDKMRIISAGVNGSDVGMELWLPYDTGWSKNVMWRRGRLGRVYKNESSAALCRSLAQLIRTRRLPWRPQKKLHVGIVVSRPDRRADSHNFVDLICDAVESGTGVNDRWYTGYWDWNDSDKSQAGITVTISQWGGEGEDD